MRFPFPSSPPVVTVEGGNPKLGFGVRSSDGTSGRVELWEEHCSDILEEGMHASARLSLFTLLLTTHSRKSVNLATGP